MFRYSESFNLSVAVVAAFFCLCPLVTVGTGGIDIIDVTTSRLIGSLLNNRSSLLAAFFIVTIPTLDLLLDLPAYFISYFYCEEKHAKKCSNILVVIRLSNIERSLFILGVAAQSAVAFVPTATDIATLTLVYKCTYNFSLLMVLCPVVTFLSRCTTTYNHFVASYMILTSSIGFSLSTVSYFYEATSLASTSLAIISLCSLASVGLLNFMTAAFCFYKFCREKMKSSSFLQQLQSEWLLKLGAETSSMVTVDVEQKNPKEGKLYTHYVPALHMLSALIIAFTHDYSPTLPQYITYYERYCMTLFAQVIVLVIELRIRKNEITRGLIALLDSKKSYVRHISHELRTPLNTAFLGLKLLTGEMKASKDVRDIERYDTLCDVNMSCMVAVDILNDLLCYEKLDSGILELHKEDVAILPFLHNCMSMFSVQARECDVKMTVITEVRDFDLLTGGSCDQKSFSVQPNDSFFVDKFKMDQVIRNLISNALKFTPRGGTVTIEATFVPDPPSTETPHDDLSRGISFATGFSFPLQCALFKKRLQCFRRPRRIASDHGSDPDSSLTTMSTAGKLVVVVTDSGAGISAENQKRLFKDIIQFSPEKLQAGGGSGLGLWISGAIVDLHDGKISVHSEGEGMGSSFTFEMPMIRFPLSSEIPMPISLHAENEVVCIHSTVSPVKRGDSSSTSIHVLHESFWDAPLTELDCSPPESNLPKFEVLVVDDSRLNRKMLLKCLQKDGHRCTEAEDGLQAIERVKQRMDVAIGCYDKPFDAILMDFIMPNMDGPTTTKHLRGMGYTGPIFGVTGNGLPSDVKHFLECGATKILLKPLDIEAFGEAMREIRATTI